MNYIPLTQVCDFQGGSQPPKEQWIDHAEDGYIRMLQIRDFTQPDKDNIEYVRLTKTVKTCNEDDILIGRYGASVGKILTGLSGAYNVAIIKTIPDASKLTKRFLYHYLKRVLLRCPTSAIGDEAPWHLSTAATRSARFFRHRRRSHRSPARDSLQFLLTEKL